MSLAALRDAARELVTPTLAVLLGLQVLAGILVAPLFSLFPVYVEGALGLSPAFTAGIRVLFTVLGGLAAFLGSGLQERLGRKGAYLLGMTGVLASGFLFLTQNVPLLLAGAVYAGLMFGFGSVAGQSYLIEGTPAGRLGLATAAYFTTGTLGNALGNGLAGLVFGPDRGSLAGGFQVLGIAIVAGELLLIAAAYRLLPALPRPEPSKEEHGTAAGPGMFRQPGVWLLMGLRFFPTVYWGIVTLLFPLLLFRLTRDPSAATAYTAWNLVVSGLCQLLAGRLIDRLGPRGPALAAAVVLAGSALGNALLPREVWAIWLFGILGAGAAWSISITMTSLVQQLSSDATRARLLGLTHMVWSAGFIAGTLVTGLLMRRPGAEATALWIGGACSLVAAFSAAGLLAASRSDLSRESR